jgi:hypothetical protein
MNDPEKQQIRIKEFMQLLPISAELAGLPRSEHGKYFTPEQIEARVITLRAAFKVARQMMVEISNQ